MTSTQLRDIRRRSLASLTPSPRLQLSHWIEQNVRLPEDVSATPGAVRLWKPQREIADAIGDPAIERVTVVKPVRLGFTTLLTAAIGNYVANEPSPILVLLPTEADARGYMVDDIEPIFEATPSLQGAFAPDASEGARNTLLHRRFAGGSLKVVAAKAPRNLRRHNVRILVEDEIDAMEITREGDPTSLAEKRTLSFANRKIIKGSTPVFEDGAILKAYAQSDQRIFEIPCMECGTFFELQWRHIEWQPDRPETAACLCPSCQALISEKFKPQMVQEGRWRALKPGGTHAGFRINALVSGLANASWGKLAAEFLAAKDDPATLQVFTNTVLAEGWREAAEELNESELAARCEDFSLNAIPADVVAITAGVDVQDDRLEITLLGWTRSAMIFVLGHLIIFGAPDDDTTWTELEELARTKWAHPWGGKLKIDAMLIDSGDGDWTERVYSFAFPRAARRIMAGKGMSGARPALLMSKSKVKGGRLWMVGVDGLKATILSRLSRGNSIRFASDLEPAYFEQLTSERKIVRYVKGQPVKRFERKPGARAEALDCMVYGMAARQGVQINFDQRESSLRTPDGNPPLNPAVIKSDWMRR
jgi:phage terminase large subunit GpA-like protein